MNNESKKNSSRVSTPKKVALAILGALTILTVVNLIESSMDSRNVEEPSMEEEHVFELRIEEETSVAVEKTHPGRAQKSQNGSRVIVERITSGSVDGEVIIEEVFGVSAGEQLSVQVGDADIRINSTEEDQARVKLLLEGDDMRKARDYFDDQRFDITMEGETVYVRTDPIKKNQGWRQHGGARITVDISIPNVFNADIRTSDGDIRLSSLEGSVVLHTSDGDIFTERLMGPSVSIRTSDGDIRTATMESDDIHIRTSDGDIHVADLIGREVSLTTSDGDIRGNEVRGHSSVSTSDGDIFLNTLSGDEVNVRTSDGEIVIDQINGDLSKIQTSDGSIMVRSVSGELTAKTSSGDIRVVLNEATNVYLRSGDGDILVDAPEDYAASLYLKGDEVRVSSTFTFNGTIKEDEAEGSINGGGYTLEARASEGEIIFREN